MQNVSMHTKRFGIAVGIQLKYHYGERQLATHENSNQKEAAATSGIHGVTEQP